MKTVRMLSLLFLLALVYPVAGWSQGWGYAWANTPTSSSYTPSPTYSYNSAGGAITATRSGTGAYAIRFSGLGGGSSAGGNVQVTGYGGSSSSCKVASWASNGSDFNANVRCFNSGGSPADAQYSIMVTWPTLQPKKRGYAWTNNATSPSYTPNPTYSYNSTGGAITATRSGTGTYAIKFSGLGGGSTAGGNVQVTGYGSGSQSCKVASWNSGGPDFTVNVRCYSVSGQLVDSQYSIEIVW